MKRRRANRGTQSVLGVGCARPLRGCLAVQRASAVSSSRPHRAGRTCSLGLQTRPSGPSERSPRAPVRQPAALRSCGRDQQAPTLEAWRRPPAILLGRAPYTPASLKGRARDGTAAARPGRPARPKGIPCRRIGSSAPARLRRLAPGPRRAVRRAARVSRRTTRWRCRSRYPRVRPPRIVGAAARTRAPSLPRSVTCRPPVSLHRRSGLPMGRRRSS